MNANKNPIKTKMFLIDIRNAKVRFRTVAKEAAHITPFGERHSDLQTPLIPGKQKDATKDDLLITLFFHPSSNEWSFAESYPLDESNERLLKKVLFQAQVDLCLDHVAAYLHRRYQLPCAFHRFLFSNFILDSPPHYSTTYNIEKNEDFEILDRLLCETIDKYGYRHFHPKFIPEENQRLARIHASVDEKPAYPGEQKAVDSASDLYDPDLPVFYLPYTVEYQKICKQEAFDTDDSSGFFAKYIRIFRYALEHNNLDFYQVALQQMRQSIKEHQLPRSFEYALSLYFGVSVEEIQSYLSRCDLFISKTLITSRYTHDESITAFTRQFNRVYDSLYTCNGYRIVYVIDRRMSDTHILYDDICLGTLDDNGILKIQFDYSLELNRRTMIGFTEVIDGCFCPRYLETPMGIESMTDAFTVNKQGQIVSLLRAECLRFSSKDKLSELPASHPENRWYRLHNNLLAMTCVYVLGAQQTCAFASLQDGQWQVSYPEEPFVITKSFASGIATVFAGYNPQTNQQGLLFNDCGKPHVNYFEGVEYFEGARTGEVLYAIHKGDPCRHPVHLDPYQRQIVEGKDPNESYSSQYRALLAYYPEIPYMIALQFRSGDDELRGSDDFSISSFCFVDVDLQKLSLQVKEFLLQFAISESYFQNDLDQLCDSYWEASDSSVFYEMHRVLSCEVPAAEKDTFLSSFQKLQTEDLYSWCNPQKEVRGRHFGEIKEELRKYKKTSKESLDVALKALSKHITLY